MREFLSSVLTRDFLWSLAALWTGASLLLVWWCLLIKTRNSHARRKSSRADLFELLQQRSKASARTVSAAELVLAGQLPSPDLIESKLAVHVAKNRSKRSWTGVSRLAVGRSAYFSASDSFSGFRAADDAHREKGWDFTYAYDNSSSQIMLRITRTK